MDANPQLRLTHLLGQGHAVTNRASLLKQIKIDYCELAGVEDFDDPLHPPGLSSSDIPATITTAFPLMGLDNPYPENYMEPLDRDISSQFLHLIAGTEAIVNPTQPAPLRLYFRMIRSTNCPL